ncbi:MAG: type II toxin-antitoxin system HicA family toxin [Janthinobacterium lividum]
MLSPTNRKTSDLRKMLEQVGYLFVRQAGSHLYYKHPSKQSIIILPDHGSRGLPAAITASILKNIISSGVATESEVQKAFKR